MDDVLNLYAQQQSFTAWHS